jgi:hypothetical protein
MCNCLVTQLPCSKKYVVKAGRRQEVVEAGGFGYDGGRGVGEFDG